MWFTSFPKREGKLPGSLVPTDEIHQQLDEFLEACKNVVNNPRASTAYGLNSATRKLDPNFDDPFFHAMSSAILDLYRRIENIRGDIYG